MHSLDAALAQLRDSSTGSTRLSNSRRLDRLEQSVRELAGALVPRSDCAACQVPVRTIFDGSLPGKRPLTATERARLAKGLCPDCGAERPADQVVIHLRHENVSGVPLDRSSSFRAVDTPAGPEVPDPDPEPETTVPPVPMPAATPQVPDPPVVSTSSATSPLWLCPTCGAGVELRGQLCNDCALAAVERRSYPVARSRRR